MAVNYPLALFRGGSLSHLVFNSFPRSGNVFLSKVAGHAFSMEMSAAHMPEIFGVAEIQNVSIFRRPVDAIASLVNKTRENWGSPNQPGPLDSAQVVHIATRAINTYDRYIDGVAANLDKVQVVLFEDLIKDYRPVIEVISKRFMLEINKGYEDRVVFDRSNPIWANKYDGHMPREKDVARLEIESLVSSLDPIASLTNRYHSLLEKV